MLRLLLLTVLGLALIPAPARAWNSTGHSVIALLAYRQLSDAERQQVQAILKQHPHYGEFLAKNVPVKANRDEWIVMQASVWPDWIKGGSREVKQKYNRSNWHYTNIPIRMLDGATDAQKKTIEKNIADRTKDRGLILSMIPNAMAGLKDPRSTPEERAVHFCWILHLIGDLHQPLHAATCFTKDSLDGDLGGNLIFVEKNRTPSRLHGLWDDSLGQFQAFDALDELSRVLVKRSQATPAQIAVADPKRWAEESHLLAETVGYRFNGNRLKGEFVADFLAKPKMAPPLPEGYEAKMRDVAQQRAALAAPRLANAIRVSLPRVGQ